MRQQTPTGRSRHLARAAALVGVAVLASVVVGAASDRAPSATSTPRAASGLATKPNILVVMTDDQTVESLRVMTNVRRLIANQGTTFTNHVASFPLCCPSRATFLTGQYGHNNRVMGNQPPEGGYAKLDHSRTLAVWLQRAGYTTIQLGKFLNGYGRTNSQPTDVPPGWSDWHASVDPSTYRFYDYTLNENGRLVTFGSQPRDYQMDVYARKAVDLIRRHAAAAKPFFLYVNPLAPHTGGPRGPEDPPNMATPEPAPRHRDSFDAEPLPTPPSFNEEDVSDKPATISRRQPLRPAQIAAIRQNYQQRLESLLAVDEAVAEMVEALRQAGELDNTVIVFTADNGFMHGEHRIPSGKVVPYEPSIRVPLIIRGPNVPRGQSRSDLVANIDIAPTILDAADARPVGRTLDGRSLLPLARDPLLASGRDILLETQQYSGIRTHRYVYVEYRTGEKELYDLVVDPHQLTSRHADPTYALVRQELARRLAQLRSCSGNRCRQGPRLTLKTAFRAGTTAGGARCARSSVRADVAGTDARWISQVEFFAAGKRVATDVRAPYRATLAPRVLGTAAASKVRARVALADGRRVTLSRSVRACG